MGTKQTKPLGDKGKDTARTHVAHATDTQQSKAVPVPLLVPESTDSSGISSVTCVEQSSVPMPPVPPAMILDPSPDEDMSHFIAPHPDHLSLHPHIPCSSKCDKDAPMDDEGRTDFYVQLMPHQHTLFCERRVRTHHSLHAVSSDLNS